MSLMAPDNITEERLEKCRACPNFYAKLKVCGVCKCFMPVKASFSKVSCPIGQWGPTEEGQEM